MRGCSPTAGNRQKPAHFVNGSIVSRSPVPPKFALNLTLPRTPANRFRQILRGFFSRSLAKNSAFSPTLTAAKSTYSGKIPAKFKEPENSREPLSAAENSLSQPEIPVELEIVQLTLEIAEELSHNRLLHIPVKFDVEHIVVGKLHLNIGRQGL